MKEDILNDVKKLEASLLHHSCLGSTILPTVHREDNSVTMTSSCLKGPSFLGQILLTGAMQERCLTEVIMKGFGLWESSIRDRPVLIKFSGWRRLVLQNICNNKWSPLQGVNKLLCTVSPHSYLPH